MIQHPSEQVLDALHLGALADDARAAIVAHATDCSSCRKRMRIAEASRQHFVEHVLPRHLPRFATKRRSLLWWLIPPMVAAAAVVGILVLRQAPSDSGLAIKGGPVVQIYANHGDHVVQLLDGMSLAPGDRIRFVIQNAAAQHVLIASIDAAGTATVYYPYGGSTSQQLPDAPSQELPGSVILDRTLGPERVFAFLSHTPIAAAPVLDALREVGARGASAIRTQARVKIDAETQLSLRFEKVAP